MARQKKECDPFFDYYYLFFTEYLSGARNCSPATIKAYRTTFRLLAEYCDAHTRTPFSKMTMGLLDHSLVVSFMAWLKDTRGNAPATLALRLSAIKTFLGFCADRDPLYTALCHSVSSIPSPKVPDRGVQCLSREEFEELLSQPDATRPKGLRDLTFMALMYAMGARMQEMLTLRLCDITIMDGIVCAWLTGKGNKRRIVPIEEEACEHLLSYLEEFHPGATALCTDLLFYTVIHGRRCPMSDDCARAFMKKYAASASGTAPGLSEGFHPHRLRHTRALHLYQSGNDLISVRDFLGHASLKTTDIYARADARMLKEAVRKVVPVDTDEEARWLEADIAERLKAFLGKSKRKQTATREGDHYPDISRERRHLPKRTENIGIM